MIDKLIDIKNRFEEVGLLLVQSDTLKDQKKFGQLSKEYRDLEKVVQKYDAYQSAIEGVQHAKDLLMKEKDPEMRELAKAEIEELEPKKEALEAEALHEQLKSDYQNMSAGISSSQGDAVGTLPQQIANAASDSKTAEARAKQAKMKIDHLSKAIKVRNEQ